MTRSSPARPTARTGRTSTFRRRNRRASSRSTKRPASSSAKTTRRSARIFTRPVDFALGRQGERQEAGLFRRRRRRPLRLRSDAGRRKATRLHQEGLVVRRRARRNTRKTRAASRSSIPRRKARAKSTRRRSSTRTASMSRSARIRSTAKASAASSASMRPRPATSPRPA